MKDTRYTITSKKIIAFALAFVMLAVMLVGCTKNEPVNTDANKTTTEAVGSSQSGDNAANSNDDNIVESDNQTDIDNSTSVVDEESSSVKNDTEDNNTSKYNSSETTTKKNTSSSGKETTTKKNSSSGSSNKVTTTTTQPKETTTNVSCKHSWKLLSYTNGYYVYKCSKCDDRKKEEKEFNPDDFMGSKSEYLELLGYINEARRKAGLNELVYVDDFQKGANTRAKELTVNFSHTRPNGMPCTSVYNLGIWGTSEENYCYSEEGYNYMSGGENIVSGALTAKQAFDAWMNSSAHKGTILRKGATHFVAARCNKYWEMSVFGPCSDIV